MLVKHNSIILHFYIVQKVITLYYDKSYNKYNKKNYIIIKIYLPEHVYFH